MHKTTLRCTHHWPAKGKLIEQAVATTTTSDISEHNLGHSHQWTYKKGHSTKLLLVKMIEDWRRALDKNLVVGIVFFDFRKVFHSFSHHVLLNNLQAVGVADDLWCWLKDYSAGRSQATVKMGFRPKLYLRSLACHRDLFWDLTCFRCFAIICLI